MVHHIQYHRLIDCYIELFGADNVLVLPVELLGESPQEFFDYLSTFMGIEIKVPAETKKANASTRTKLIVNVWRPFNFILTCIMWAALVMSLKNPAAYSSQLRKVYPFVPLRYKYYSLKRHVTRLLTTRFSNLPMFDLDDFPDYDRLVELFAKSNERLADSCNMQRLLARFAYPLEDVSETRGSNQ